MAKKIKFTGVFSHEPLLWIGLMGIFAVPFFLTVIYSFRFGSAIRWEFLILSALFAVLYHVSQLKYHLIPELRND